MPFRYIGDKKSKKFHSLRNEKPACQVDEITQKRKILFPLGKDAIKDHYHPCSHCINYWKSRR